MSKTARQRDPSINTIRHGHKRAPLFGGSGHSAKAERRVFLNVAAAPNGLVPKGAPEHTIMYRLSQAGLVEFKRRNRDKDWYCVVSQRGLDLLATVDAVNQMTAEAAKEGTKDYEQLHADEDSMRGKVLESIAKRSNDPWAVEVARVALQSAKISFTRACS